MKSLRWQYRYRTITISYASDSPSDWPQKDKERLKISLYALCVYVFSEIR